MQESAAVPVAKQVARQNYDTAGKASARSHWAQLLTAGCSAQDLAAAQVLFFPSEGVGELPHYRMHGLQMANLHGVEWKSAAAKRIPAAASGFALHQMSATAFLEEWLSMHDDRFLGIWLDYDGSYTSFPKDIALAMRALTTAAKPCLGVTSHGARDRDAITGSALGFALLRSCFTPAFGTLLIDELRMDFLGCQRFEELQRRRVSQAEGVVLTNTIAREVNFIAQIIWALGCEADPEFDSSLASTVQRIEELSKPQLEARHHRVRSDSVIPHIDVPFLRKKIVETRVRRWPVKIIRFRYPVSGKGAPMFAWFLRFECGSPRSLIDVFQGVVTQWVGSELHDYMQREKRFKTIAGCYFCR